MKFFAILLITILISCSDDNNSSISINDPLIFLHYWSDDMGGGIDDMMNTFNSIHPKEFVKATGFNHESFKTSIKVMLEAGNPPDLFSYWAGAKTQYLVDNGYLHSIDSLWKTDNFDSIFNKTVYNACQYNGKPYIVPVTQHYVGFFYNKAIFEKNSLSTPNTWREFLDLCDSIKSKNITPIALGAEDLWPAQFWFDYLLLNTAGPEFRDSLMNNNASYKDKRVVDAFSRWSMLFNKGYFSNSPLLTSWSEAGEDVIKGKSAMTLMGTWLIGYYENKLNLHQDKEFGFFSFPIINYTVTKTALGPIDGIVIPNNRNIKASENIIKLFTKNDILIAMSKGSGALSPAKNIIPSKEYPIQREIHKEIQSIDKWAFNYDLATPPPIAKQGLKMFGKFIETPNNYVTLLDSMEIFCQDLKYQKNK